MNLAAFFSYALITACTPGPNNILSMESGKTIGFRRALAVVAGITAGFVVIGTICLVVSEGVKRALPDFMLYLKILGTAYILWLAAKILLSSSNGARKGGIFSGGTAFVVGLFLQFVNVKVWLYFLTAISGFILPNSDGARYNWSFLAVMCVIGFAANSLWAGFGSLFQEFFRRHDRVVNAVLAILLVYCAISIWR